ncbi:hypothetical protein C8J56DRAFT_1161903 [Mycena floridula]|nr:hypothetical protein C8J56DRAFT_1161903 [Mycena floridula]
MRLSLSVVAVSSALFAVVNSDIIVWSGTECDGPEGADVACDGGGILFGGRMSIAMSLPGPHCHILQMVALIRLLLSFITIRAMESVRLSKFLECSSNASGARPITPVLSECFDEKRLRSSVVSVLNSLTTIMEAPPPFLVI